MRVRIDSRLTCCPGEKRVKITTKNEEHVQDYDGGEERVKITRVRGYGGELEEATSWRCGGGGNIIIKF